MWIDRLFYFFATIFFAGFTYLLVELGKDTMNLKEQHEREYAETTLNNSTEE